MKYVDGSGDVMTGVLEVPALITNGGITLPSVYTALPTQTQLGGVYKSTISTVTTDSTRNTVTNYATLSLPAGCYMIITSFGFTNSAGTGTRPNLTFTNLQGGFSTVFNDTPTEYKIIQFGYNQVVGDGGTITMNGSTFYQHNNSTNRTVYMNCFVGVTGNCTVLANFTAVRVG